MKRRFFYTVILFCGWLIFAAWGFQGHWKINEKAPFSLPEKMVLFKATWPALLAAHSSDADERKQNNPTEEIKHYINLDSYPEFSQSGRIPQTLDSVIALHGSAFVMNAGILPWAILSAFDSLENSFARHDWNQSVLFASDLGHYTGDGHQPLHLTGNYDGQLTGQNGIHGRYETNMISNFYDQLVFPFDSAIFIEDVNSHVFDFIYRNYKDIGTILQADVYAKSIAGNSSSITYYNTMWSECGDLTVRLFKNASLSLAGLIYTAWIRAGSPVIYPNSIRDNDLIKVNLEPNYPNPFSHQTTVCFYSLINDAEVRLKIYDQEGKLLTVLFDGTIMAGHHQVTWNASDCNGGIYSLVLTSGKSSAIRKLIVVR